MPFFLTNIAIIPSSLPKVWAVVSKLDFAWWNLVASSSLVNGTKSFHELDGNIKINFKDGTKQSNNNVFI